MKKPEKGLKRFIKVIIILISIFLLILIILPFIALPLYLNRHVSYDGNTEKNVLQDIYEASDYNLEEEQRYLETEDGYKIWISEITTEQPKAILIYTSGIMQPSVTYFYAHAKFMQEKGYASILLEVRGHGNSEGKQICLGYEEVKDVKAVVDYIKNKEAYADIPIILQGVSMGGSIAVNAFGQLDEIDGLIAMSAYSSFEDVLVNGMDRFGIPKIIQVVEKPLIRASLTLMYGSKAVNHMKPIEQIKNANGRPVLLIACTGDTEVPIKNMEKLSKAYPEAEVWIRDSWEHFIVKECDFKNMSKDQEYCDIILSFLNDKVLND